MKWVTYRSGRGERVGADVGDALVQASASREIDGDRMERRLKLQRGDVTTEVVGQVACGTADS